MNHLKRKLQEIIDNIDDSICAMSSTSGTSAAGALRAVAQGQQGNSSQTETVSFAARAADYFRYIFFYIVYFVFICITKVSLPWSPRVEFLTWRNGTRLDRLVTVSLAPIVQTLNSASAINRLLDSAIHRINHYPADSAIDLRHLLFRAGHFLRLDRNRKPRMKGLWNPG